MGYACPAACYHQHKQPQNQSGDGNTVNVSLLGKENSKFAGGHLVNKAQDKPDAMAGVTTTPTIYDLAWAMGVCHVKSTPVNPCP